MSPQINDAFGKDGERINLSQEEIRKIIKKGMDEGELLLVMFELDDAVMVQVLARFGPVMSFVVAAVPAFITLMLLNPPPILTAVPSKPSAPAAFNATAMSVAVYAVQSMPVYG